MSESVYGQSFTQFVTEPAGDFAEQQCKQIDAEREIVPVEQVLVIFARGTPCRGSHLACFDAHCLWRH